MFITKLRSVLKKARYEEKLFSTHSFRLGGSNFAQRSGVPPDMIKSLGGWKSDAYQRYLEPSDHHARWQVYLSEDVL